MSNPVYDVIFVDDEASLTEIFQQYALWKYKNWRFLTFNNPTTVFNEVTSGNLSAKVWILDMMMPKKNGAELAAAIRQQAGDTPVILAYTALDRHTLETNESYREGIHHFTRVLNKRDDFSSLLSLVEMWVG